MDRKANLFIVGAMRAGTTSLYHGFASQELIYASPIKEPHFFVKDIPARLSLLPPFFSLENYMEKQFPAYLHFAHIKEESDYSKLFSLAKPKHKYLLDASPVYLHSPESASLIKQYNPEAKIIIVLRNPLQRMMSHYKMELGLGKELNDFNTVAKKEIALYKKGKLPWHSYLGMSFYNVPVQRFQSLFTDVLVLNFDDLISRPENVSIQLEEFLNFKVSFASNLNLANNSHNIQHSKLLFLARQMKVLPLLSRIIPTRFRHAIFKKVFVKKENQNPISSEIKDTLEKIFKTESSL